MQFTEKLKAEVKPKKRFSTFAPKDEWQRDFYGYLDPAENNVPYEDFKKRQAPQDVKPDGKEFYLSDPEFLQYLGMTKAEWNKVNLIQRSTVKNKLKLN